MISRTPSGAQSFAWIAASPPLAAVISIAVAIALDTTIH
jgi:hypothetical protein